MKEVIYMKDTVEAVLIAIREGLLTTEEGIIIIKNLFRLDK